MWGCDHTMPFGPKVDFTRSAIAIAPTNEACAYSEKRCGASHGNQAHPKDRMGTVGGRGGGGIRIEYDVL